MTLNQHTSTQTLTLERVTQAQSPNNKTIKGFSFFANLHWQPFSPPRNVSKCSAEPPETRAGQSQDGPVRSSQSLFFGLKMEKKKLMGKLSRPSLLTA